MGKGDQRTRRGKIFAGSHGKPHPNPKTARRRAKQAAGAKKGKK